MKIRFNTVVPSSISTAEAYQCDRLNAVFSGQTVVHRQKGRMLLIQLPLEQKPAPTFDPEFWGKDSLETPVPPWKHLVARRHPWRRQLYIKGRNMTVRQLVGTVKANKFSEEEAARNLDLPVDAIREALQYAQTHKELLDYETAYERLLLAKKGCRPNREPVPR
jgi:uncharacterized protein (DUF433 family)